jgi:hypothetical protein
MVYSQPYTNGLAVLRSASTSVLAGIAALSFLAVDASAQTEFSGRFGGGALGIAASANAGPAAVGLTRISGILCPCQGTGGNVRRDEVQNVSAGTAGRTLRASEVETTAFTDVTVNSAVVRNTARVSGLNMLGGLIRADGIVASASVTANASKLSPTASGSRFVNLRIAGRLIGTDVAPNTRVVLPGVGSAVLKKIVRSGDLKASSGIAVTMLFVEVTRANSLGLPVGARITVANARAQFARSEQPVIVSGHAFISGANARVSRSLQTALRNVGRVIIGCEGTGGKTRSETIASLKGGSVVTSGTGRTTAVSRIEPSLTTVRTTASIEGVSLLGGLFRASAVTAVAQDTLRSGKRTSSTAGSGVTGVRVQGILLGNITAPNRRLNIPGVGYVVLNERAISNPGSFGTTRANGIRLVVTTSNSFGLPVGAQIIIAQAVSRAFFSTFARVTS